jgi:hypothetical protein
MSQNIFLKLENDIMKILSRNSDKFLSQYKIYEELLEDLDIKDPYEKNQLKIRLIIVLKQLSSIYNNVSISLENKIMYAKFCIDSLPEEHIEESTKSQNESEEMPNELSVVQFVIDNKLTQFYSKKDFEGNTILHTLVKYSDFNRVEEIMTYENISFFDKNKADITPMDLITDIRISNLLIKNLMKDNKTQRLEIIRCKEFLHDLKSKMESFFVIISLYFISTILYYLVF